MKRRIFQFLAISAFLYAFPTVTSAQDGYEIQITITDRPDSSYVLAYYYNESTYTRDTAKADGNGKVVFRSDQALKPGVYILVLEKSKSKLFDFAVYDDQHFALITNSSDYYKNMKVEGDINNTLYFENLLFNAQQNEKASKHLAIANDANTNDDEKRRAREQLAILNEEVMAFQDDIIEKYPGTLVAKILNARKPVTFPEHLNKPDDELKKERYDYYKSNYWNGIDFTDDAILRLPFPLFSGKLNEYFDQVVMQQSDSIINEMEEIINQAKVNSEMYKFIVWTLTSKYYAPEIMGLDEVFVHLSDKYFKSGEMDYWANAQLKGQVLDRAGQLRLSMVGMEAPNLIMQDANLKSKSLHDINSKYTVIYFYDPDCGHCKEETPILVDFTKTTSFNVQVYSVCADTSMVKMNNYIKEMGMENWVNVNGPRTYVGHYQKLYDAFSTPTVYVLDEKKKIIAKKLPSARLEEFLTNFERRKEEGED